MLRGIPVVGVVALLIAFSAAQAQEKQNDEGVLRFLSMAPGLANGRRHVIVRAEIPGGRAVQIAVPNQDENRPALDPRKEVMDTLKSLKAGDLIKVSLEAGRPMPFIQSAEPYEL